MSEQIRQLLIRTFPAKQFEAFKGLVCTLCDTWKDRPEHMRSCPLRADVTPDELLAACEKALKKLPLR